MEAENNTPNIERSLGRVEGKLDLLVKSVSDLSSAFQNLEAGRLSRLEVKVNTLDVQTREKAKNTALFWAFISSLTVSAIAALLTTYFK